MDIFKYYHDIRKHVDNKLIKKISILNIIYIVAVLTVSVIVTVNAILTIYYFLIAQIISVSLNYLFWIFWATRANMRTRLRVLAVSSLMIILLISITILVWGSVVTLNFL